MNVCDAVITERPVASPFTPESFKTAYGRRITKPRGTERKKHVSVVMMSSLCQLFAAKYDAIVHSDICPDLVRAEVKATGM